MKTELSEEATIGVREYQAAAVINVEKEKNSFYLHEVALKNKKDTLPFKTEPRHESGLLSDNVSIYNLLNKLQNVNNTDTKFSLDVDRFSNDLRNAQLWQYDGYERFSKAKELYQQKSDIFHCYAK